MSEAMSSSRIGRPARAVGVALAVAGAVLLAGAATFTMMVWSVFELLMLPF